jgi:serine/threonine protein kinase
MAGSVTELHRPADVPEKIGKYVIINKVGKGSTGTVYLSHDPYYRRDVAIKVYKIEEDQDPDRARVSRKMFFNEAHMVGMLQHPNIMPTENTTSSPSMCRVPGRLQPTAARTTCFASTMSWKLFTSVPRHCITRMVVASSIAISNRAT